MHAFFGPWSLRVTNEEGFFSERFEITGSDGVDGLYVPASDGTPLHLDVRGQQWTIDFQASLDDGHEWFSYDLERITEIVEPQGLTVTLTITPLQEPSLAGAMVFNHHLNAD